MRRHLPTSDILVLHGARQVGKTSVLKILQSELERAGKPTVFIDLEDMRLLVMLDRGPESLIGYLTESGRLKKEKLYVFVDEIQYLKNPSNLLKILRDHHGERIKLIVSGSSSFEIKSKFKDSLAGRTVNFELLPLSFREFLRFKGEQANVDGPIDSPVLIERLKELFREFVLYGAYPRVALENEIEIKESYLFQIISTYVRKDVRDLAHIRDIDGFNKLLEALAAQNGQLLNVNELAGAVHLSRQTIEHYLFLLENTYVIRRLRPFSRNVRSELFKTPKVFFLDSGIAQLLWLQGFQKVLLGNAFENAVYSELMKNYPKAEIRYWRTQDGKEIDFIFQEKERLLSIEVKKAARRLNARALRCFHEQYHPWAACCVALDQDGGEKDDVRWLYPWEGLP